jgi:hypothetical protein
MAISITNPTEAAEARKALQAYEQIQLHVRLQRQARADLEDYLSSSRARLDAVGQGLEYFRLDPHPDIDTVRSDVLGAISAGLDSLQSFLGELTDFYAGMAPLGYPV